VSPTRPNAATVAQSPSTPLTLTRLRQRRIRRGQFEALGQKVRGPVCANHGGDFAGDKEVVALAKKWKVNCALGGCAKLCALHRK
jgi:hypothetical protein